MMEVSEDLLLAQSVICYAISNIILDRCRIWYIYVKCKGVIRP